MTSGHGLPEETASAGPAVPYPQHVTFFNTLRGSILTSIPALSALVFVVVAVKVFRASGMEATTTVAVVSSADPVALLKGVVLTLLPGFLTAVTATALWWWSDVVPAEPGPVHRTASGVGLLTPQAAFAWAMVAMAFFTVSWPLFLMLFAPAATATGVLAHSICTGGAGNQRLRRLRICLKGLGGTAAVLAVGFLTLAPSLWVPLRAIHVADGQTVAANGRELPREFAAYLLEQDEAGYTLLLAEPRAVVAVGTGQIEPFPPLCVTPESPARPFFLRMSQVLRIDPDNHSPYQQCPDLDTTSIFGT